MNNNDCQNRREAITALVLGEMETGAAVELKEHIAACQQCYSFYQSLEMEEQIIQSTFNDIVDRSKPIENKLVSDYQKSPDNCFVEPTIFHLWGSSSTIRRYIKIAAAAIIVVAILVFNWFSSTRAPTNKIQFVSGISFLSKACAAESTLFSGSKIAHIINEIKVYPATKEKLPKPIDKLNLSPQQRKYFETVNSWLDVDRFTICSLQANGQFRFSQLKLSKDINQPYTVTDEAWYDSSTGRFARLIKIAEQVIFANSYDGEFIYFSETSADGSLRLLSERIHEGFQSPKNPAEFLGITAGLQSSIGQDNFQPPILDIKEGIIDQGLAVNIYKLGFADLFGQANTYWLFKVRKDNDIVEEMEFILAGSLKFQIRRILSGSVESPVVSWNLAQIDSELRITKENPKVAVNTDMILPNVSVRHMVDKAGFETCMFGVKPSWTKEAEICDIADFANPAKRMFFIVYPADDERHVIMGQSESFNVFFSSLLKGSGNLIYTSSNGSKLWAGGPEKWWTEIHIKSCGFTPAQDRCGYVIESPAGTFASLAINGKLTDKELINLVDCIVPAKKVLELSSEELQALIKKLPAGKMEYKPLPEPNN